jgi:hypothetical protein
VKKTSKNTKKSTPSLVEGVDFYVENGLFVFTEKYHLERGFCCKSGCRHCPYFEKKDSKNELK